MDYIFLSRLTGPTSRNRLYTRLGEVLLLGCLLVPTVSASQANPDTQDTSASTDSSSGSGVSSSSNILASSSSVLTRIAPASYTPVSVVYDAAEQHDAQYQVARIGAQNVPVYEEMARSLWRPTVGLQGSVGYGSQRMEMQGASFSTPQMSAGDVNFISRVPNALMTKWGVMAQQPLYNISRRMNQLNLQQKAAVEDLMWQTRKQALILGTAGQYYQLALLKRTCALLSQQLAALEASYQEARYRFKIGDAPSTAVHESNAMLERVRSELVQATNDYELLKASLLDNTLLPNIHAALPDAAQLMRFTRQNPVTPDFEQYWQQVQAGNTEISMQAHMVNIARNELRQQQPLAKLSIDAVGQMAQDRASELSSDSNQLGLQQHAVIGVAINAPLYTGGYQTAERQKAAVELDKAKARQAATVLKVKEQARQTWTGVGTQLARLEALKAGVKAAYSRLEATQLGLQAGDRTQLDVMNAQNDLTQIQLQQAQAQVALLMDVLQYRFLSMQLTPEVLLALDPP